MTKGNLKLSEICRLISFIGLKGQIARADLYCVKFLKQEFLDGFPNPVSLKNYEFQEV